MLVRQVLEATIRKDRLVVLGAVAVLAAVAFVFTSHLGAVIDDDRMARMFGPLSERWGAAETILVWLMWAAMMTGMMTPSVAPIVLLYARVGRSGDPSLRLRRLALRGIFGRVVRFRGFSDGGPIRLGGARLLSSR